MADAKISALTAITAPVATDEMVVASGGATKKIVPANLAKLMPGYVFDIAQITTTATTTQTSAATADTVITGNAVTYDGVATVEINVMAAGMKAATNGVAVFVNVWRKVGAAAATDLGVVATCSGTGTGEVAPVYGSIFDAPTAASIIYYAKMWVSSAATGSLFCTAPYVPATLIVRRRA